MKDSMAATTGPGGPHISSAKKRRLAALEQRSTGTAPPPKRMASTSAAAAAPTRPSSSSKPPSSRPPSSQSQQHHHARRTTAAAAPSSSARAGIAAAPAASDFVYAPLSNTVASGPVAQPLGLAVEGSLSTMLQELLATNPRAADGRAIAGGKLRDKTLLLDNPAVQREQGRRRGGGPILTTKLANRKEQRQKGLYDLKNAQNLTYASVQDLHRSWQEYAHALTHPAQNLKEAQQLMLYADLHGCLLRVVEAPEPRFVGLRGIVVRDSCAAFFLVTPEDRVIMVPKKPCVFEFSIDGKKVVTLLGAGLVEVARQQQQEQQQQQQNSSKARRKK